MATIFNSVQGLHPRRNAFSAHTYRNDFTAPLGVNIPVYWQEVPPATRIKVSASALVRLQALIAPIMDNVDYYVHFWKIPYRLLEDDRFTKFISGEILPEEYDALFEYPVQLAQTLCYYLVEYYDPETKFDEFKSIYDSIFGNGSLFDFLGYDVSLFPILSQEDSEPYYSLSGGNNTDSFNYRTLIAYFMLHQNWYMNENVPYFDNFTDAVDSLVKSQDKQALCYLLIQTANMHLTYGCSFLPHAWEKDYFTSALPNVQYGSPVTLPLAGSAPVTLSNTGVNITKPYLVAQNGFIFDNDSDLVVDGSGNYSAVIRADQLNSESQIESSVDVQSITGASLTDINGNNLKGTADLSQVSAITINELRFANALQVFKERQMRYGRRRLEHYKGFFDVSPEDLRLHVPKYLGGGRIPINIADIEQTSSNSGSQVLGHLAGKATAVAGGFAGFSTFCSEESVILGIAFAMPHITYAQQVSRFRLKTNDIYDYFNPSFEHLGEQAVKNIEIFAGAASPDGDFGYQPRYTEYRFHSNEMHGAFKDSLAYWTLGRIFDSQPALNADFIYMQPSVFNRIFAVDGEPPMVVSMLFHVKVIQPVSKYGTPMLLA